MTLPDYDKWKLASPEEEVDPDVLADLEDRWIRGKEDLLTNEFTTEEQEIMREYGIL